MKACIANLTIPNSLSHVSPTCHTCHSPWCHHNNTNVHFSAHHGQISLINIVSKCSRASHITPHEHLVKMVQYTVCTNYIRFNANLLLWAAAQAKPSRSHCYWAQAVKSEAKAAVFSQAVVYFLTWGPCQ
jgi:hypothetical protein